jgi:hypothetical protein
MSISLAIQVSIEETRMPDQRLKCKAISRPCLRKMRFAKGNNGARHDKIDLERHPMFDKILHINDGSEPAFLHYRWL